MVKQNDSSSTARNWQLSSYSIHQKLRLGDDKFLDISTRTNDIRYPMACNGITSPANNFPPSGPTDGSLGDHF